MRGAKPGDIVSVHYIGTYDDNTEFDSSHGGEPLIFTVGEGDVIVGFEEGVIGLVPGQAKTIHIPCERAYGPRNEEMVVSVSRSEFPSDIELETGLMLEMEQDDGAVPVTVTAFDDETVTLDGNHPLAGRNLNFELTLVEIMKNLPPGYHSHDCDCGH